MKEYNSLLIEISKEGRKAYSLPKLDVEFTKIDEMLDYNMIKKTDLDLEGDKGAECYERIHVCRMM